MIRFARSWASTIVAAVRRTNDVEPGATAGFLPGGASTTSLLCTAGQASSGTRQYGRVALLAAAVLCLSHFSGVALAAEQPAEQTTRPLWLVVGSDKLVGPLGPLVERRRSEGFEAIVSTESVEAALAAVPRRPDYLLLVGDDQPGLETAEWYLPAQRIEAHRWRRVQPEQFASDAIFGDFDGDRLPDVPVGRIPARSPAEVQRAVEKIIAFERRPATLADLDLAVWTGSPQFGALLESTATELLLSMLRQVGPAWASPWVVAGNANHPLCGWPADQAAVFTRQISRGGVCNAMMGHGSVESFFSMFYEGRSILYRAADVESLLAVGPPTPPLVIFCCSSGDFVAPGPCLAESLFAMPGGPVATVAATSESHPLPNYFSGTSLLTELSGRQERLGDLWLASQRRAIVLRSFLVERLLLSVEGELEKLDQTKLRRDQILLYALLGDPATRLKTPRRLEATIERTADGWRWTAKRPPGAGRLAVGHRPATSPDVQWVEPPTDRQKAMAAFEAANRALDFTPQDAPPEGAAWGGTVTEPGSLRLATVAEGQVYVTVLKVE